MASGFSVFGLFRGNEEAGGALAVPTTAGNVGVVVGVVVAVGVEATLVGEITAQDVALGMVAVAVTMGPTVEATVPVGMTAVGRAVTTTTVRVGLGLRFEVADASGPITRVDAAVADRGTVAVEIGVAVNVAVTAATVPEDGASEGVVDRSDAGE